MSIFTDCVTGIVILTFSEFVFAPAMYLNKYDFLNQAVGIRSAARIYFGKEPKVLKIEESAMLVGMLKNSSYFNPLRRAKEVKQRRNVVLKQMNRNAFISLKEKAKEVNSMGIIAFHYREDVSTSGVANFDDDGAIISFIEKPKEGETNSNWVNAGMYFFDKEIFDVYQINLVTLVAIYFPCY